jgi:DNA polymerase-3 subunit delta'
VPVGPAIALLQRWATDLLAVRLGGRVLYHPRDRSSLARLAAPASVAALFGWIDHLREARASADHPLNPRLVVEQALLRYRSALAGAPGSSHSTVAQRPPARGLG